MMKFVLVFISLRKWPVRFLDRSEPPIKACGRKSNRMLLLRKAGHTKKRYKGLDQAPKYVSPTLTYHYGHDYSFKKDQHVSVLSLDGRVIVPYTGYDEHLDLIQKGAQIGAAKLWYDKPKKRFYLLVSLEIETPDPTPQTHKQVVGVDVGLRYLAVTSTTKGDCTFSFWQDVSEPKPTITHD